ncbi:MAG TPA: Stp1/IreP family PP2C-type Ser/Thr phosphatase [Rhodothermales bacterium]|nr:Stp1/IreP family PP2C-type Ser/Thr phosphatase [Rhodothermales bacterium]
MTWWKTRRKRIVEVGVVSDVGQSRSENQDAYGCFTNPDDEKAEERLFVVADGMGGHLRGEEASRLAVAVLQQTFFEGRAWSVGERLRQALETANDRVYREAQSDAGQNKMGTTCTAMALVNGHVYMAHVGDSRAYRIDESGIEQLTRDHTLVNELQRQGVLTEDEARTHPRRHALTRALGIQPTLEVDILDATSIKPSTSYLLCSDGLAPVTDDEIRDIVSTNPPQDACEQLVRMTNERGGPDNVTVLIVTIQ